MLDFGGKKCDRGPTYQSRLYTFPVASFFDFRAMLGDLKTQKLVDGLQCLRVSGHNHDLGTRIGWFVMAVNLLCSLSIVGTPAGVVSSEC